MRQLVLILAGMGILTLVNAQSKKVTNLNPINSIYADLPLGKYKVGFKILTLTDYTRVDKPEYNYLGEKNEGDRARKITIHLWYPADGGTAQQNLKFEDYCYNQLLRSTIDTVSLGEKNSQVTSKRQSIERWFGKISENAWTVLLQTPMLAYKDARNFKKKFPLLIGTLRPLSTTITNELLASNGFIVAMVSDIALSTVAEGALNLIPDMQFVINYFTGKDMIEVNKIGTFGFSGSGFIPVLFGIYDFRVKAIADIESGIYMDGLFQSLSASNYYKPSKLQKPFLHIFSRDLSKQEKYIDEFEKKSKFSKRYRLLLNQPALHHWDFATEGYMSCTVLKIRGEEQNNIKQSYEIFSHYLLNFFDAELNGGLQSKTFLSSKPSFPRSASTLWDITLYNPLKPAPDKDEFEYIIKIRGIDVAITTVKNTIKDDSTTNLLQGFLLNRMGYDFLNRKKYKEALGVFTLNTELHPDDANFFDSLAEGYEIAGENENKKKASQKVIDILGKKIELTPLEKSIKETAEKRLKS